MESPQDEFEVENTVKGFTSNMIYHVMRLEPGMDLYVEMLRYIKTNRIQAATIVSCVGSLQKIHIRTATAKNFIVKEDNYEILSLVGSVSVERNHVHISLGDYEGNVIGGHLMQEGNIVYTTAELVLGEFTDLKFSEKKCQFSGWPELSISTSTFNY
jgi:predicted DNA-binding protein with PD1-like motif